MFFAVIGLGVVVFATTNIDDILLLSAFFADRTLRPRAVVVGQFAGIGALTVASGAAAFLALAIPEGWTSLLGLAPLALGLRRLQAMWAASASDEDSRAGAADTQLEPAMHSQWLTVAFVTVANGGDNLGVYIPLFTRHLTWVPVYAIVFALMTAFWCAAGYWLVHHPAIGARARQYGHLVLPFVLIGLGIYILSDVRILFQ